MSTVFALSNSVNTPSSTQILMYFVGFLSILLFCLLIKKIYYRFKYKKRFFIFPKLSVKGITNVAMVVSISIAIILLLSFLTADLMQALFRAYPGWRIMVEAILIMIGGLFFGPIIGLFVGAATDLLTIALSAGAFNYGYFVGAMIYGIIAGLIRYLIDYSGRNQLKLSVCGLAAMWTSFLFSLIYILSLNIENFNITFLGLEIELNIVAFAMILFSFYVFFSILLTFLLCLSNRKNIKYFYYVFFFAIRFRIPLKYFETKIKCSKNKSNIINQQVEWYAKNSDKYLLTSKTKKDLKEKYDDIVIGKWFNFLAPVLICVICVEPLINLVFLPVFDVQVSGLDLQYWLIFRLMTTPFSMLGYIIIIYPIFRIISPTINYFYKADVVEDLTRPLVVG